MISEIKGDLFATDAQVIAHGCNTLGSMGAGVAKIIAAHYPEVLDPYRELCDRYRDRRRALLGQLQMLEVTPVPAAPNVRHIANLFTQLDIGTHKRQVDYEAVRQALAALRDRLATSDFAAVTRIAMPRIGAGLAGGDWSVLRAIIDEIFGASPVEVKIFYL